MSDLDKRRLEIKLILENQNIRPGTDSSIKKVKTVLNKIKTSVQNDKEATDFLTDVSQTNFEKYLDEVATVLATELMPKRPATMVSFIHVLAVLDVSYPGFFKLYHNKWTTSQFDTILQSFKKNPDSVDKYSTRLLLESYLAGYDIFLQSINAIFSLIMRSPVTYPSVAFVVYLSKVIVKFDKERFSSRADLWRAFDSFVAQFSESVKLKVNALLGGITLQSQKNQSILETRGALNMDQSASFLNQLNDFQALLGKYSELCSINNIVFTAEDWKIDQPLTENGRVVFVDNSVSNDEIVASFSSREEYNYYSELDLSSTTEDSFSDVDKLVDYFKHMQSYLHVDPLAKFFLASSPALSNQEDFVASVVDISKTRYDLIPAIARFFALIRPQYPGVCDLATQSVFGQSMNFIHKRFTSVGLRNRMAFFVGEFVKFSLFDHSSIFNLLKKCADNLDSSNFEFTVQVLHGCGKFLYFQPATRKRMENTFRLLKKNYTSLLPSEYGSLETIIQIILGCEGTTNVELESTESMYISFLLARIASSTEVAYELLFVSRVLGVNFVVESLLSSRSLCYIPVRNICLFLGLVKKPNYYEAIDLLLLYTSYEVDRFPFVDKQFVLKCVEIVLNETLLQRLKVSECVTALSYLIKKDPASSQDSDWLEFIGWYRKTCLTAALSFGVDIQDAAFATAHGESQEESKGAEGEQPYVRDCDNIDMSMDECIAKMCSIATEERKALFRSREEPFSYLGSPRKAGESQKFILLRGKGKKGNDFRKVA